MLPDSKLFFLRHAIKSKITLFVDMPSTLKFYASQYLSLRTTKPSGGVLIVSFPKSGRTWLEQLFISASIHKLNSKGEYTTWGELAKAEISIPDIEFSHVGSSWEETKIIDEKGMRSYSPDCWAGDKKIIFLYRNPRDVIVSAYHHIKNRTGIIFVTPDDMLDNRVIGLRKLLLFMNKWLEWCESNPNSMAISYEELRTDGHNKLLNISEFCDTKWPIESIDYAIEKCDFNRMKIREANMESNNPWLLPRNPKDPNSFKVRSGKSGEYKELFSEQQIDFLERTIEEMLLPSFPYHKNK